MIGTYRSYSRLLFESPSSSWSPSALCQSQGWPGQGIKFKEQQGYIFSLGEVEEYIIPEEQGGVRQEGGNIQQERTSV